MILALVGAPSTIRHLAEEFAGSEHGQHCRPGALLTFNAHRAVFNEEDGAKRHVLVEHDIPSRQTT